MTKYLVMLGGNKPRSYLILRDPGLLVIGSSVHTSTGSVSMTTLQYFSSRRPLSPTSYTFRPAEVFSLYALTLRGSLELLRSDYLEKRSISTYSGNTSHD